MFTGIVQHVGQLRSIQKNSFGARLAIDVSGWRLTQGYCFAPGDSIAVSGVCLTISDVSGLVLEFDVIAQTLSTTTLGGKRAQDRVNLEHALMPTTPLGGHMVQGHVDGVGQVQAVVSSDKECRIAIAASAELMDYVTPKGSIAVDGVSLTVAQVASDFFELALIPTTLRMTTLASLAIGSKVNLETDILNRTIVHWLKRQAAGQSHSSVNLQTLRDAGFL